MRKRLHFYLINPSLNEIKIKIMYRNSYLVVIIDSLLTSRQNP